MLQAEGRYNQRLYAIVDDIALFETQSVYGVA